MRHVIWILAACLLSLILGLIGWIVFRQDNPDPPSGPIQLRSVMGDVGIDFQHTDGSSGKRYIIEPMSAGLALFDYDGDNLIDIYFLNGAPLLGAKAGASPRNALYRNLGGWRFQDVTEEAGLGDLGYGLGVTVGDYNNDGAPDLYLNNHGENVLYRNNGDGAFSEVTQQANVANGALVGAGASFLDIDRDGDLDLYVGNYLNFDYSKHVQRKEDGRPTYPSPRDYQAIPDTLYQNNGDGTFTDVSSSSGIAAHSGTAMGVVSVDYDRDGDADIFVMNDVAANFLFRNNGFGEFEEVGASSGVAYNGNGDALGSMGVDCGDYNNDGRLDFFMTSYQNELPVLYENQGDGFFEDVTRLTNAGANQVQQVGWGTGLVDFDNDGDLDIFVANGHTEDNIDLTGKATYRARNVLLMNRGEGEFIDISETGGDGMQPSFSSRGAAFDDLDNDGRIDVVVVNAREKPSILRNESPSQHHWIVIKLKGVQANRDGIGALVALTATVEEKTQTAEVLAGRSYQSYYGAQLHFGLGASPLVQRLQVKWPGGETEIFENLPANQVLTIRQGEGRYHANHNQPVP